jgi:hypothetical protein
MTMQLTWPVQQPWTRPSFKRRSTTRKAEAAATSTWINRVSGDTHFLSCPATGEYFELTVTPITDADAAEDCTLVLYCLTKGMPERTCIPMEHTATQEGCHRYAEAWLRAVALSLE